MALILRPPPSLVGLLANNGLVGANWQRWFFDIFSKTAELDALAELTYVTTMSRYLKPINSSLATSLL